MGMRVLVCVTCSFVFFDFANQVLLPLCTSSDDADVRYLALFLLKRWVGEYLKEEIITADRLIYDWLINLSNVLLCSDVLENQVRA